MLQVILIGGLDPVLNQPLDDVWIIDTAGVRTQLGHVFFNAVNLFGVFILLRVFDV